jgi:hypothetical protein
LVKFLRQVLGQSMLIRAFSKSPPSQSSSRAAATRANSRGMICLVRFESASSCWYSAAEVAAQYFWLPGACAATISVRCRHEARQNAQATERGHEPSRGASAIR